MLNSSAFNFVSFFPVRFRRANPLVRKNASVYTRDFFLCRGSRRRWGTASPRTGHQISYETRGWEPFCESKTLCQRKSIFQYTQRQRTPLIMAERGAPLKARVPYGSPIPYHSSALLCTIFLFLLQIFQLYAIIKMKLSTRRIE